MSINTPYRSPEELPVVIPVFPLRGVLLLPRGQLPLNIFEPRYMAMVDDALKSHRLIGMIQPAAGSSEASANPELERVGGIGRLTQVAETGDGRYMLSLTGVCRFRVEEELTVLTPYRQCRVSYDAFAQDLVARAGEEQMDRPAVLAALRSFAEANGLKIDWQGIERANNEALVNALSMMCPFGPLEKQALLEASDVRSRAEVLVAITEMELARGTNPQSPLQ
jgi:Lon protease-like protein